MVLVIARVVDDAFPLVLLLNLVYIVVDAACVDVISQLLK